MKLVIVESPTKCKNIGQYLGPSYKVMASVGHIRDLSTSGPGGLGVDVNNNFKPTYIVSKDKTEIVKELKKYATRSEKVILATDPDREGEAIAWHLAEVLKLDVANTDRLEFHEITKPAIMRALENPRTIDMNLVASQETRRIMDRITGFKLSHLLQKKIHSRSAGRVQSVTLKFIVDREKEIDDFTPEEYWTIEGYFSEQKIKADLVSYKDKPIKLKTEEDVKKAISEFPKDFKIESFSSDKKSKEPRPPFTTSTLQQEAFNQFHYSTKKTSLLAQHLYEGQEINGEMHGLITYMRTDSTRLSPEFIADAVPFIEKKWGAQYCGTAHRGKNSKNMQDAHEAIRPTDLNITPEIVKNNLSKDEYNLYRLIYARTVASLMKARIDNITTLKLRGNDYVFKAEASSLEFDGYDVIYKEFETNTKDSFLPNLSSTESLSLIEEKHEQHFTKAPSRYTEARIVKLMEEKGIGRPSTYAATISTLSLREYVTIEKGTLTPTEQGKLTIKELVKYFPTFMDPSYTAEMETRLDSIVAGDFSRNELLHGFYDDFSKQLENADEKMEKIAPVETGEICPQCGKPLVIRHSRYGDFEACSGYPECNYIKKKEKVVEYVENKVCPECGSPLVKRISKSGKTFYGCSNFPKCKYIENPDQPKEEKVDIENAPICPKCGVGHLITRHSRFGSFIGCSNYPKCKYTEKIVAVKDEEQKNTTKNGEKE